MFGNAEAQADGFGVADVQVPVRFRRETGMDTPIILVIFQVFIDEVTNKILYQPVKITYNDRYEEGMLSSVQCGFNALSKSSKAGMILLGDQPMVKISVINKLIECFFKTRKGIVIPVYYRLAEGFSIITISTAHIFKQHKEGHGGFFLKGHNTNSSF